MVSDMTSLTAQEAINQVAPIIGDLGSKFMLDKATMDAATEAGYGHPFALYFLGRGGVLGDVDADVIVAAFAFFEPGMVRTMWDMARQTADVDAAVKQYAGLCAKYGETHLGAIKGLESFNELAEKVIDSVDVSGLSLFAGWRKVARPSNPAARAYPFGWAGDCGDLSHLAKTREAIEQATTAMQVPAFSALSGSELAEFVDLVQAIKAAHN